MEEETEYITVEEKNIQEVIQYFLDGSPWGEMCGTLPVKEKEWEYILRAFKKLFKQDAITREFIIDISTLFTFINEQIVNLFEGSMLEAVDGGLVDMMVNENGEIIFKAKD